MTHVRFVASANGLSTFHRRADMRAAGARFIVPIKLRQASCAVSRTPLDSLLDSDPHLQALPCKTVARDIDRDYRMVRYMWTL